MVLEELYNFLELKTLHLSLLRDPLMCRDRMDPFGWNQKMWRAAILKKY